MRAGKLNSRITIEELAESADTIGGVSESWAPFATVWAEFITQSGREFFAAKQNNTALDCLIRIRYLPGVTAQMRVKHGSRTYSIIAPPIDTREEHVELKLMCEELRG